MGLLSYSTEIESSLSKNYAFIDSLLRESECECVPSKMAAYFVGM